MFHVYLLKSERDGMYYIGQTKDAVGRLRLHNAGLVTSTRSRRPFQLVGFETHPTRDAARWREHTLKKSAHQRRKFIAELQKNVPR